MKDDPPANPTEILQVTVDSANTKWHTLTVEETMKATVLRSLKKGVAPDNVEIRRKQFGDNIIPTGKGPSLIKIIFGNFVNSITAILAFVAVVSGVFEDWAALGISIFVILFVGIIGAKQEWDAAQSLEGLKNMTKGTATVIRGGQADVISVDNVVVGDIIVLEQGTCIPADLRLFDSTNLEIDEALLTGEALPVSKKISAIKEDGSATPLGDRINMAYRNSTVTSGRGKGIAVAIGLKTEIGKMAEKLTSGVDDGKTELQKRMERLMYAIFAFCLVLVIIVFSANKFNMTASVILYGAAVAIAILPQSLVAVVAIAMSVSVRKMAIQKCIVRKLGSLEVLDRVTDICSDKTGTLTQNKMVVSRMLLGHDRVIVVTGAPLNEDATFREDNETRDRVDFDKLRESSALVDDFVMASALCGTTSLNKNDRGDLSGGGNPTEIALAALAWKCARPRQWYEDHGWSQKGEYPFDSSIKRMTASFRCEEKGISYIATKGAPERVLKLCKWRMEPKGKDEVLRELTDAERTTIENRIEDFAKLGLRTICLAKRNMKDAPIDLCDDKRLDNYTRDEVENELIYLGIVGIYDPPRPESALAVRICRRAGIRVRMLTGDHYATAAAIAKEIGIIDDEDLKSDTAVMKGPDFDALTETEAKMMKELPFVIGRCSPDTKVRMIKELRARGQYMAMTGDGFNDSPSISDADIGCAMGSGTDVTKGVADLVITDDNFATIVRAVAEGRRISLAISKFVTHLLCGNCAEVVVLIFGLGIMQNDQSVFLLSPMEILWLNLFTSSPPAIGLSMDAAPPDVLRVPPNLKGIFNLELFVDTMVYGIAMGSISLCSFIFVLYGIHDGVSGNDCNRPDGVGQGCDIIWRARSTAYVSLYFNMLLHAYNVRFSRKSFFLMPKLDNNWLWGSFIFGIATIIPMLYVPWLAHNVFVHEQLSWEWGVVGVGFILFLIISEIFKCVKNAVSPVPVYAVTAEEEENERRLFSRENEVATDEARRETRATEEIAESELQESFARQASFTPAH